MLSRIFQRDRELSVAERSVPFFDYQYLYREHGSELLASIEDVMRRGAYIMQHDMFEIEERIADYVGVKHALGVANCTDGLLLIMRALNLPAESEVIFPSHTFVATASSIHYTSCAPVPVECGRDHMIDVASVEAAITDKTRIIMPVQLNGRTANMDALQAVADKHDLLIVEDAAQALGSEYKGKRAGSFGIAAAFSFYPAKILPCLGDGGMVTTNDDALADKIYALRDHGRSRSGEVISWGGSLRLDNMQAAILLKMFEHYPTIIQRRREMAAQYEARLSGIPGLLLPVAPNSDPDHFDVFQNYEIEVIARDDLEVHLQSQNIGTIRQWGGSAVHQLRALGFTQSLPATEQMTSRELLLPMNMALSDDDVSYVCDQIIGFFEMQQCVDKDVLQA